MLIDGKKIAAELRQEIKLEISQLKNKYKKTQNNDLFFKNLYKIGYRYLNSKYKTKIIKNFQRKYRQKKINGIIDFETLKLSQILSKSSN